MFNVKLMDAMTHNVVSNYVWPGMLSGKVGGDGNGFEVVEVVTDDAGVATEGVQDSAMPLIHQVPNRRHNESGDLTARHGGQRHFGLTGAGGHDDLSASVGLLPGVQCLILFGS